MAGPLESIRQRGEEALAGSGDALGRVSDELPAFVGFLRAEPRLRAALTDISVGSEGKRDLLRSLLEDRVDPKTLEVIGLLVDELLSPEQLLHAAADLAVTGMLAAAEVDGELEDVEDELFRFARVIDSDPALRNAITDPVLPADVKAELIRDLLEGRAEPATLRLVEFVVRSAVDRDPAAELQRMAELAAARRGRVVVEARTAVPIDVQRRARMEEALSQTLGRRVDLEVVVDPGVLGGVVARAGDELIDGTVRRRLELALEEMTS